MCRQPGMGGWAVAVLVSAAAFAGEARAAVVFVPSRADLAGADFVDWSVFGPPVTVVPQPAAATSAGGVALTVSQPGGPFVRYNQSTGAWSGNFAVGDAVLSTFNGGPLTVSFPGGVTAAGAQIQSGGLNAPFTAAIEAFDLGGVSLGVFTRAGFSAPTADNTAIFLGVKSDGEVIGSVRFSLVPASGSQSFAINRLDFTPAVGPAPVPEPGAWALLLGAAPAGLWAWRRRRG